MNSYFPLSLSHDSYASIFSKYLVLIETLSDETPPNLHKNRKNLIKEFINAKKIEGCSKRTGEYYTSVLTFYEKNIGCDLCLAESETM